MTWSPAVVRADSERNCVSNIRPLRGLSYAEAANRISWLMIEARRLGHSGIALKDRSQGMSNEDRLRHADSAPAPTADIGHLS